MLLSVSGFFAVFVLSSSISYASWTGEEFYSSSELKAGSIVLISSDKPDSITLAGYFDSDTTIGVVAEQGSGLVNYSREGATNSVALDGEVDVFVSDLSGIIKKGDLISLSWLTGVGMRYEGASSSRVIGIALQDFNQQSASVYGEVDTPNGAKSVSVTSIRMRIVRQEALVPSDTDNGLVGALSSAIGKKLTAEKVLAGVTIFILSLVISGVFVTSSIRGSFISIGRNPLAGATIYRSLFHVSGISIIVMLIGATLAYVVLVI